MGNWRWDVKKKKDIFPFWLEEKIKVKFFLKEGIQGYDVMDILWNKQSFSFVNIFLSGKDGCNNFFFNFME